MRSPWRRSGLRRIDGTALIGTPFDRSASRFGTRLDRFAFRLALGLGVGLAATVSGGPIAGFVAAAYTGMALDVLVRRRRDARARASAMATMDRLVTLASDLRAGVDPSGAMAAVLPGMRTSGVAGIRMAERIGVATRVADASGARLADLLDRLERDARARSRVGELAYVQAAGAQMTAWLLAALPIAGIALGIGIGAHPIHELLRTPLGAVCAAVAVVLQAAGLAWTRRLATGVVTAG